MEKMLATFLKSMGLSPDLITDKINEIFDGVTAIRDFMKSNSDKLDAQAIELREIRKELSRMRGEPDHMPIEIDWSKVGKQPAVQLELTKEESYRAQD